ncbi:MAG TPA: YceD family protein, partial [Elainellaceae cyanobacterium]
MEAVYIPQLVHLPEHTRSLSVREYVSDLKTLTPVQGSIQITHHGKYLEVAVVAEAIVTLACDRCLQQYNHRLTIDVSELIWLQKTDAEVESDGAEQETLFDDLVETLPPNGYFYPGEWLYEQLCLAIPQRQLCDQECSGILVESEPTEPLVDRRWASLAALKGQFLN